MEKRSESRTLQLKEFQVFSNQHENLWHAAYKINFSFSKFLGIYIIQPKKICKLFLARY